MLRTGPAQRPAGERWSGRVTDRRCCSCTGLWATESAPGAISSKRCRMSSPSSPGTLLERVGHRRRQRPSACRTTQTACPVSSAHWDLAQPHVTGLSFGGALALELLLLLDNFEHVAAAAAVVSDLVARCPRLKVLLTSRAALRLRSEHEYPVSPLPPPAVTSPVSVYALATNPALDLFLRRAQAVKPEFALTQANAAVVATICQRLEGLPLALELAAPRTRVLTPRAMLSRLEHRLPFLTSGTLDLPTRQRTMRETMAWSYDLLSTAQQELFQRLTVFDGGCRLSAIEKLLRRHRRCGNRCPGRD